MKTSGFRSIAWIAIAGATACQLVAGIEDVPPNELGDAASPPSDEAGTNEPDATTGSDADSSTAADAGTWCERVIPKPTYCWDFDVPPLERSWSERPTASPAISLSLTDAGAPSPPYALHGLVEAFASDETRYAPLIKTIPTPFAIDVAFDLKIDATGAGEGLMGLVAGDSYPNTHQVSFAMAGLEARINEVRPPSAANDAGSTELTTLSSAPALNRWTRVGLFVRYTYPSPTVRVTYDGQEIGKIPLQPSFPTSKFRLYLGINHASGPTSGASYLFDNVTVTTY